MVSDKSQVWCLAGDCWIVSSNFQTMWRWWCKADFQIRFLGLWDLVGAGEKEQRKALTAVPVCVHRGWKASYIFGLCGSYYFVTKDINNHFLFSCLYKFLISALPLILERDEGGLFSCA